MASKSDSQEPVRYVTYARGNVHPRTPGSVDHQQRTMAATVKRSGLPWVRVAGYRDEGTAGHGARHRTGLRKMLADLRAGAVKTDVVLVDSVERLARAGQELASIRRQLEQEHGVRIRTAEALLRDVPGDGG